MAGDTDQRDWYRHGDETYLCSTNPAYLQPAAINAAMNSDILWWAKPVSKDALPKMLQNCLCFGLYHVQAGSAENGGRVMIGLARLITDRVTFAYLTDVYVLPEYQRKGLGGWMMDCLNEMVEAWPHLRAVWIGADDADIAKLYVNHLGAWKAGLYGRNLNDQEARDKALLLLEKTGAANKDDVPRH